MNKIVITARLILIWLNLLFLVIEWIAKLGKKNVIAKGKREFGWKWVRGEMKM
jgi:hypothetical protein